LSLSKLNDMVSIGEVRSKVNKILDTFSEIETGLTKKLNEIVTSIENLANRTTPIDKGGTGAINAATARANLGINDEKVVAVVPIGSIISYAANSAPTGYLICNGAAVSRTTYKNLFDKIGTLYGSGDGSTTFNLPNLTDKFIQGSGTAGNIKAAGLPNITGRASFQPHSSTLNGAFSSGSGGSGVAGGGSGFWSGCTQFDASKSNSIYGASTTVQPPAVTMRFYIRY